MATTIPIIDKRHFRQPAGRKPYADLPVLAGFTLTSNELEDGGKFEQPQLSNILGAGGNDISPSLSWSGAPEGTLSYVVTMFDASAPTPSGFWHWAVTDISGGVTELKVGAGDPSGKALPSNAKQLLNDVSLRQYVGGAAPAGAGSHTFYIVVHAVDVPSLNLPDDATPALLSFALFTRAIGRAVMTATYER